MMEVVVLTGPAGSGLSSAEFVFEELGFFVVKNAPSSASQTIIKELKNEKVEKACFVCHASNALATYEKLKADKEVLLKLIVLNCDVNELQKRFSLTRHIHPRTVIQKISATEAIKKDAEDILKTLPLANLYIDTTSLAVKQLRAKLYKFLANVNEDELTSVTFISFGIKNGIPQGIDTFLDVRIIPNPYWVEELKELTGRDQKVIDYMKSFPVTEEVLKNITTYLTHELAEVVKSGRGSYVVGIACSGGQHRSTFVADYLTEYFGKKYRTFVIHRDCPILNKSDE